MLRDDQGRGLDRFILLFLLGLLLFVSPLMDWVTEHGTWYLPYLLWLALIALTGWLQYRRGRHDL